MLGGRYQQPAGGSVTAAAGRAGKGSRRKIIIKKKENKQASEQTNKHNAARGKPTKGQRDGERDGDYMCGIYNHIDISPRIGKRDCAHPQLGRWTARCRRLRRWRGFRLVQTRPGPTLRRYRHAPCRLGPAVSLRGSIAAGGREGMDWVYRLVGEAGSLGASGGLTCTKHVHRMHRGAMMQRCSVWATTSCLHFRPNARASPNLARRPWHQARGCMESSVNQICMYVHVLVV